MTHYMYIIYTNHNCQISFVLVYILYGFLYTVLQGANSWGRFWCAHCVACNSVNRTCSTSTLLVEVEDMESGPGVRRIEKVDEEGYGGVAINVCLGVQKMQHIFNTIPARNHSKKLGRAGGLPGTS